jgi:hypothetical protein
MRLCLTPRSFMADAVQWSIDFNTDGATYREQARFSQGPPDTRAFQAVKGEVLLNFIEKLNATFKKAAESILSRGEATPELRKQAEEIQEQFNIVDQWIAEMRKQFPQK